MIHNNRWKNNLSLGSVLIVLGSVLWLVSNASAGPLEDYVQAEDLNYTYTVAHTVSVPGQYTGYILDMKSQRWRSEAEVDRPLWQHWLKIIVPETINSTHAMLFISGGGNGGTVPAYMDDSMATIAVTTGTVVAELKIVPNQLLYFTDETIGRKEDEIIAYSWDKYLTTADPNWIAQLPMVKSAVRAMDTVQEYCGQQLTLPVTVNDFLVAGASKRGWTTWLTGAVDDRAFAIVPIVIDMLNLQKSFRHHHAAYGFWAPAIHDYEDMGVFNWFDTPEMKSLAEIVDPYEYIPDLTMPKYLVCSAGDDFFLPDSSHFYYDELLGVKYLRYVPNTDHSLDNSDALDSILAFYIALLQGAPLPQFSWIRVSPGRIEVQTAAAPTQVNLWQATNPASRDFRLTTIGSAWSSTPLTDTGSGLYIGQVSEPAAGWTAFFVELVYDSGGSIPYKFTTEVSVTPETLPFSCDLDFDGAVRLSDIASLAVKWLQSGETIADIAPPLGGDNIVDFMDFSACAEQWLIGN